MENDDKVEKICMAFVGVIVEKIKELGLTDLDNVALVKAMSRLTSLIAVQSKIQQDTLAELFAAEAIGEYEIVKISDLNDSKPQPQSKTDKKNTLN